MNNTYPKKYTDALRELVETNTTFTSLVKKYSLYDIKFKKLLNEQGVRYNLKSSLQNNYKLRLKMEKNHIWKYNFMSSQNLNF